jgi:uncharacterized membrane protein
MPLSIIKTVHILGVVLFIGNIIVSGFWKAFADRTGEVGIIRYATRLVILTDIVFTVGGIVLLAGAGHMMAPAYGGVMEAGWIRWSYLLLAGSGLIWLLILLPAQLAQARLLQPLAPDAAIPARYRTLAARWTAAGIVATLLPLPAIYLMTAKPV